MKFKEAGDNLYTLTVHQRELGALANGIVVIAQFFPEKGLLTDQPDDIGEVPLVPGYVQQARDMKNDICQAYRDSNDGRGLFHLTGHKQKKDEDPEKTSYLKKVIADRDREADKLRSTIEDLQAKVARYARTLTDAGESISDAEQSANREAAELAKRDTSAALKAHQFGKELGFHEAVHLLNAAATSNLRGPT